MAGFKKRCPRCGKIIDQNESYCLLCRGVVVEKRKIINKHYDLHKRDKQRKAFYNSTEWRSIRPIVLSRFGHLDLYDYYVQKKLTRATTIHHIIELEDDWSKRLALNNLIPLSESNHNRVHGLYTNSKTATQMFLNELSIKWEREIKEEGGQIKF